MGSLIGEHGAAHIDGEHEVPVPDAYIARTGKAMDGRRVRQRIEPAKAFRRPGEGGFDAPLVGNVDVQVRGAAGTLCIGIAGHLRAFVVQYIHADDIGTRLDVGAQRSGAHAARRAGDDDSLALQFHAGLPKNLSGGDCNCPGAVALQSVRGCGISGTM